MSLLDEVPNVPNAGLPLPWLLTCGQPTSDDFVAAKNAGIEVVIDLRDPMEPRPLDEAAVLKELGLEYLMIPVNVGALDDETLRKIVAAIRANQTRPTMLHCASANRVGGALIPFLILDQGMDEPAAVQLAMQVGLRSAELMDWGVGFAQRHASE